MVQWYVGGLTICKSFVLGVFEHSFCVFASLWQHKDLAMAARLEIHEDMTQGFQIIATELLAAVVMY